MEWVSVQDNLPDDSGVYMTKVTVGSVSTKTERQLTIFKSNNGGRWCAGDWKKVTHWKLPESNKNKQS